MLEFSSQGNVKARQSSFESHVHRLSGDFIVIPRESLMPDHD
jgi:hypothetical protein